MRDRLSSFVSLVVIVAVVVGFGGGCASVSTVKLPACASQFEVDGEHQRRGPRTLVLDHGLDAPWTYTEFVVDHDGDGDGPQDIVRVGNTTPHGGRLVAGVLMGAVGGAVATAALVDMSDGRIADYGPVFGLVFGSAGFALGSFLALTGWGPGRVVDVDAELGGQACIGR